MATGPHLPILGDNPATPSAAMVEIQLGHMCNNRCVFCSSGQATALGQARPMDAAPILAALDEAKAGGARKITFVGGEPTLQRAFLPALAHAQRLGFDEIEIFTNGVKAARRSWVDEVVALGEFTWRFSIQGGNRQAHDRATAKPGAFDRITAGMDNVRATGQRMTANACINEHSYRSLPDYPELVRRYGVQQLHLDVVRPQSAGERTDDYFEEIIPRHEDMAPYFAEMLERFEAWDPDFDVNVGNFPYCLLPQWAHKIHHGGQPTVTFASGGDNSLYTKDKYEFQHSDKHHAPGCARCVFRPSCTGVFEAYGRVHGIEELRPVSVSRLREVDPRQRAFVMQIDPHLARLAEAAAPAGWSKVTSYRAPRDRLAEVRLSGAGGELTLQLRPIADGAPADALVVTDRFWIGARATGTLDPSSVPSVAAWLRARLAADPLLAVDAIATDREWIAATMDRDRLARARRLIAAAVGRIDAERDWPTGWSRSETTPDPAWPGTRLRLRSADGDIVFTLRVAPPGARQLVRVDVEADPGLDRDAVRAVATRLRRVVAASGDATARRTC